MRKRTNGAPARTNEKRANKIAEQANKTLAQVCEGNGKVSKSTKETVKKKTKAVLEVESVPQTFYAGRSFFSFAENM